MPALRTLDEIRAAGAAAGAALPPLTQDEADRIASIPWRRILADAEPQAA